MIHLFIEHCKVDDLLPIPQSKTLAISKCAVADKVLGQLFREEGHMPNKCIMQGLKISAASLIELIGHFLRQSCHDKISFHLTVGLSDNTWRELWNVIDWKHNIRMLALGGGDIAQAAIADLVECLSTINILMLVVSDFDVDSAVLKKVKHLCICCDNSNSAKLTEFLVFFLDQHNCCTKVLTIGPMGEE